MIKGEKVIVECPFCESDDDNDADEDLDSDDDARCDHLVTEWINDSEFFLSDSEGIVTWYECDVLIEAVDRLYATWATVEQILEQSDEQDEYARVRSRVTDPSGWLSGLIEWESPMAFLTAYGVLESAVTRVPGIQVIGSEVGGCGMSAMLSRVYSEAENAAAAVSRALLETADEVDRFEEALAAFRDEIRGQL